MAIKDLLSTWLRGRGLAGQSCVSRSRRPAGEIIRPGRGTCTHRLQNGDIGIPEGVRSIRTLPHSATCSDSWTVELMARHVGLRYVYREVQAAPPAACAECLIEFESPAGSKLRIHWPVRVAPDWTALLRAWRGTEQ